MVIRLSYSSVKEKCLEMENMAMSGEMLYFPNK